MVPADKEELRKLVTDATMETYEDLSYQLIKYGKSLDRETNGCYITNRTNKT